MQNLRPLAKKIEKNHQTALELWETGIHEAKILVALVDEPKDVTLRRWSEGSGKSTPGAFVISFVGSFLTKPHRHGTKHSHGANGMMNL